MYCPTCGAEYAQKLNYCKRCGSNMTTPTNTVEVNIPRPRLTGMFGAVSLFSLIGLIACFVAYTSFVDRGLRKDELYIPFLVGLMFVSGISGLLVWQLSRIVSLFRDAVRTPKIEAQPLPQSLPQYQTPPLAIPSEPISSISEHTTHSFDPAVYPEKRRQHQ